MNATKKKVAFHTLGCKLNFAETSTIARSFSEEHFEKVPAGKKADIYIINTCSVTDAADKKCRQAIKRFIHQSPGAFIAVVGCYAQLNPNEISEIPGVDLVLGINEKFDAARFISSSEKKDKPEIHSCELSDDNTFNASYSIGDRTRSFLKVQDGCDYGCSYCTIPMARGKSKNPGIPSLIDEAEAIARGGVKEIVLTGVNIGDFGKSTGDNLTELIRELVKVNGIERIRISSIEPNLLTNEMIELASHNPKILPHFHIPLQSGSNRILGLMRRRYKREKFQERISYIKKHIPFAGIGADIIVGFPGETDTEFSETLSFLSGLPLSYLHVFSFSERPGTIAADLPGKIEYHEKERRSKLLIGLSQVKEKEFIKINTGQTASVLFERIRSAGMITGYTCNYLRVEYPWDPELSGQIHEVKITGITSDGKIGIQLID